MMEDFILGLMMIRKFTAYELHIEIKNNHVDICSSSIGNIQRALKKLHGKEFVNLEEVHEGKVVKKVFGITPAGRERFMNWLNNPLDLLKAKNMELGRLLLMGYLTEEQQLANIDCTIAAYKKSYEYVIAIEEAVKAQEAEETANASLEQARIALYEQNKDYFDELMDSVEETDFLKLAYSINKFSMLTLKLGIDEIKFNLNWFENLRKDLAAERER